MTLLWFDLDQTLKTFNLSLLRFIEQSMSKNHDSMFTNLFTSTLLYSSSTCIILEVK